MSSSRLFAFVGCGLVTAACANDIDGVETENGSSHHALLPAATDAEKAIPGFGGYFIDDEGIPTLYLTPSSSRAPAEEAFGAYLDAAGIPATEIRVLDALYTWQELERWQDQATHTAFPLGGIVFVDNDESTNSLRIGVESAAAGEKARATLEKLGIPAAAIIVEQTEPVSRELRGLDRPARGGVQIQFPGFQCSLGFNVDLPVIGGDSSFITNSHCSSVQGGVEGTPYAQPFPLPFVAPIGTEVADPIYFAGGACPAGRRCRRSDASRVRYTNANDQALGLIARTSGANNGSVDIVGSFAIVQDDLNNGLPMGALVNKVGRTTGWTGGRITGTCVNVNVQDTDITQLCQNLTDYRSAGGDSGGPVFQVANGTNVRLEGIHWGGNGVIAAYSPLQGVIQDLGVIVTH